MKQAMPTTLCASTLGLLLTLGSPLCSPALAQDILWHNNGEQDDSNFYGDLVPIGDITADGVTNFVYGMPAWRRHTVVSGADWSELFTLVMPTINNIPSSHGSAVCAAGDWNGDGVPDYAVGARAYSTDLLFEGIVRIYSGSTHQVLHEITHHVDHEGLGAWLYALGDITGDGLPEIAIQGGEQTGRLWIYSAPGATLLRVHDVDLGFFDAKPVDDMDGDGVRDYLYANPSFSSWAGLSQGQILFFFWGNRTTDRHLRWSPAA